MVDLSTNDARLALAKKWATKYSLDAAIVAAVIEQESTWNPYAVRFEPAFLARYVQPLQLPDITETQLRAHSFGLMQIMGQTAREFGFLGKFLTELCDPDTAVDFGCRKLAKCFTDAHGAPEKALLTSTGGG